MNFHSILFCALILFSHTSFAQSDSNSNPIPDSSVDGEEILAPVSPKAFPSWQFGKDVMPIQKLDEVFPHSYLQKIENFQIQVQGKTVAMSISREGRIPEFYLIAEINGKWIELDFASLAEKFPQDMVLWRDLK